MRDRHDIDPDGCRFHVVRTARGGVLDAGTPLAVRQRRARVWARYQGGAVRSGRSVADVARCADGRLRLTEHFRWRTRQGHGVNLFETRAP